MLKYKNKIKIKLYFYLLYSLYTVGIYIYSMNSFKLKKKR